MKAFVVGLWTLIVALGASYAVAFIDTPAKLADAGTKVASLTVEKTRVLNVPMITGGAVRGTIIAQFAYTIDAAIAKTLQVPPEVYLLDEAFRRIYTDDHLDFRNLQKYDIGGLTKALVTETNKRLGQEAIHDVLVQDFTFVSKEENEQ